LGKSLFILTEKDLVKLAVILLLAVIFYGLTGLIIMLCFQWITLQSYAADAADKHGISQVSASRLGGLAIFISWLGLMLAGYYNGYLGGKSGGPAGPYWIDWFAVGCCAVLGLAEDLRNNMLSPRFRLFAELAIFAIAIAFWPLLIPIDFGLPGLDALMAVPVIGWFLTVVFCVGFINAVNMSDGANGLMPGIMTIAYSLFYLNTGEFVYAAMMTACGLFTLFNVISGRLFLGDTGAYGLGASLAISALYLFSQDVFSAAFLACLFAYPCIDFVVTLIRRYRAGRSIFLPDNDHLHNRIHYHFQQWLPSKTLANSMTGVLVVASSSGLALAGYLNQWWLVTSHLWGWVFLFQWVGYGVVFYLTGLNRSNSQYVVAN
jgi:UDP-N-acetylmuramyl pentapeptide phosphotransferase/UDP-N-acetylglucosamine-1-phosphate transferase